MRSADFSRKYQENIEKTCRWRITKIRRQSAFGISRDNASANKRHLILAQFSNSPWTGSAG